MSDTFSILLQRDRYPYPREILRLVNPKEAVRTFINSRDELDNFLKMWNTDIAVSLFSKYQQAEREYDMIFLDIDEHDDLVKAYQKLELVIERLEEYGILNYLIVFSGSKGFHVYVPFKPTRLLNYRQAVLHFLKDINISDLIDSQAVNSDRLARLPKTINSKSDLMAVVVGNVLDKSLDDIIIQSQQGKSVPCALVPNENLGKVLLTYDSEVNTLLLTIRKNTIKGNSILFTNEYQYPPCMARLVELAKDGVDLNHIERMEMGIFLLHVFGGDKEKVAKFYSLMSDFEESKTMDNLGYIENQLIMKCENLDYNGICCMEREKCPFNPSIGVFLKQDIKLIKQGQKAKNA